MPEKKGERERKGEEQRKRNMYCGKIERAYLRILINFLGDVTLRMFQHVDQLLHLSEQITNTSHPHLLQVLLHGDAIFVTHVRLQRERQIAEIVQPFINPAGKQQHAADGARQWELNEAIELGSGEVCDTYLVKDHLLLINVFIEREHVPRDGKFLQARVGVVLINYLLQLKQHDYKSAGWVSKLRGLGDDKYLMDAHQFKYMYLLMML